MTEWFEEWFGEEYLQLYPHRDFAEAEQAVGVILEQVGFVDYANGNYRLAPASKFKKLGAERKDAGANIDALEPALKAKTGE